MRVLRIIATLCLGFAVTGGAAQAQPFSLGVIDGPPVVVLNQERLFSGSLWGQRVQSELESASSDLVQQNRAIEAQLLDEEQQLTQQRSEMTAEEFQPLADAFDARVEEIRATQDERLRELNALADAAQRRFLQLTTPVLRDLLSERGAAAVLDSRAVIYLADGADITDAALARIDQAIGEGGEEPILDQLRAETQDAQ